MLSLGTGRTLYGKLTMNDSSDNLALYDSIVNNEHRYLLQKYFQNEGTYSITTVGAQSLTATGALSAGATSLTLSAPWAYHTTTAFVSFSSGDTRIVNFTAGSTAATWASPLSASATTALSVGALQYYPLPPNYSKLKSVTLTVGVLKYTPTEIKGIDEWNRLNTIPFYADIPSHFIVYPGADRAGQIGIWPTPASTGNTITFSYKFRVPDLRMDDYSAGTVSVSSGATAVTGAGTAWPLTTNRITESRWIRFNSPAGDDLWYQIESISAVGTLSLYQPYMGTTVTGGTYLIGQMPFIAEDFHDMLLCKAMTTYYSSTVDDDGKRKEWEVKYAQKEEMLQSYCSDKTVNVDLTPPRMARNANLYQMRIN